MNDSDLLYTIPGVKLQLSDYSIGDLTLYQYQQDVLSSINVNNSVLVEIHAGTGMGKTAIAVAACLSSPTKSAIMLYPTNELIENQEHSIQKTCERMGFPNPEIEVVHSTELQQFMYEEGYHEKSRALSDKLYPPKDERVKFVLTNPDTFHLILQLRYGGEQRFGMKTAEILRSLSYYSILGVDEFHTYEMRELSSLFFDLSFARYMNAFPKLLLMTATPHDKLTHYLNLLASTSKMNSPTPIKPQVTNSGREVIHPVSLCLKRQTDNDLNQITEYLNTIADDLKQLRKENSSNDYIPACVILNSVIDARSLTEQLLSFFQDSEIKESHGLIPQQLRKDRRDALILVGTSAIEVGIDFDTSHLVFEAWNAPSAIQRLGRVGRHRPGHALMLVDDYVFNYFSGYVSDIPSRQYFMDQINIAYGDKDPGIWYLDSGYARFEVHVVLERICKALTSTPAAKSFFDKESFYGFFERLYEAPLETISMLNNHDLLKKAQSSLVSLRSSQPLALVHDYVAERKGLFPVYFSPLSRILRRAKKLTIHIDGIDEDLKTIYGARKKTDNEKTASVINDHIQEYRTHINAGRKVCVVDVFGYMQNGYRWVKMQLAEELPNSMSFDPIVGINKSDFLGTTIGFVGLDEAEKLDSLYENELYAIIDETTRHKLGWQLESYPVVGGGSKAYALFNADALVALACYDYLSRREDER